MTDRDYSQVPVMIDQFTKNAEAVPCITASAENTCDHDQYVNSKTWKSHAISTGQWDSFRRRTYQGAHETFLNRSGSFSHISSTNNRYGGGE